MARILFRSVSLAVWFLFGVFLVAMAAVFISDYAAVRGARDLPPPAPVPIESFDPERDALDSGEVGLAVWLVPELGVLPHGEPGDPRHATLPLFGPERRTVLGIGRVPSDQSAELREFLASRQTPEGGIVLYGWHETTPDWVNLAELGRASGRPVSDDPVYLDLFVGDREAAYADEALTNAIGAGLFIALTAGVIVLVGRKLHRWIEQGESSLPLRAEAAETETPALQPSHQKPLPDEPAKASPWDRSPPPAPEQDGAGEGRPAQVVSAPPVQPAPHWKKTPKEIVARAFRKPVRRS